MTTPVVEPPSRLAKSRQSSRLPHRAELPPTFGWVRELKRYGVLPVELKATTSIDVYAAERTYCQSLWYQPPPAVAAAPTRR